MAKATPELVRALRTTVDRLESGARYEWGHMGRCNAGHLVQSLTGLTGLEIVRSTENRLDEWSEHAVDYCNGTGEKVEDLFRTLEKVGFTAADISHLEYLSDRRVLKGLTGEKRHLRRNKVQDVCKYMTTLADILERELVS